MTRRHLWMLGLSLTLLAGVVALVLVGVHRLDFFRIRSVEVAGLRHLDERALVERLGIPEDANILVPLDPIAAMAESLPGVRGATVERRWPGTLRITILEAPAVAFVVQEGRLLVIDDRGDVLPINPARLETPLPFAEADTLVAALLGRLQLTDPDWYRQVDRAVLDGRVIRLIAGDRVVRLGATAGSEVFHHLAVVRDWLLEQQIPWTAIDARFEGRMFVQREAA